MKKKLALLFISSLIVTCSANADFAFTEESDYTGEAFFTPPSNEKPVKVEKDRDSSHSVPPLKLLRLKWQDRAKKQEQKRYELAPTAADLYTGEVETSEYASQEIVDNFDEETNPDGFEADDISSEEVKKSKKRFFKKKEKKSQDLETESIILDCENVDYDTPNYLVYATGNVNIQFVKQNIHLKADTITFDRKNNTVKAEGNVRILKGGQTVTGEYIFVDLNEENALIEKPLTRTATVEIKAQKGYVYSDKIVQENGSITVSDSYPIDFQSGRRGPKLHSMMIPKDETLTDNIEKGIIKFQAKEIKIAQKGDLETVSIKKGRLFKGDKSLFKVPSVKIYTNKNHDYAETNHWEIGSYRGLGLYAGPGFVFELPKGSVLKAMPMLNYKSGFGVGAVGRFSSGTNSTMAAYGTAVSKFIVYGKQELDDNLYLQYGVNSYMDEWFMGRRRPKYGAALVYNKSYSSDNFLYKGHTSSYSHRMDAGYYHDLDFDGHFEKLSGTQMGTTRFRYMGDARQNLFKYVDKENLKSFSLDVSSQLSASVYGTGDTQVIGRVGPVARMQYKRWMQDIGYYFATYQDDTPIPVFDAYRYGKQALYIREYIRLCRWLTLSWFGTMNLSDDSPNGKTFQENSFYFSFGPDDVKFHLGYDFVRENLYATMELMMDAKGANVEYEKLEIKQEKKAKKDNVPKEDNSLKAPVAPRTLERAVVENIKEIEDVL